MNIARRLFLLRLLCNACSLRFVHAGPTHDRPTLLRAQSSVGSFSKSGWTPSVLNPSPSLGLGTAYESKVDLILFRIDCEDTVLMWKGKHPHSVSYDDPPIGSNIIAYWKSWNLGDIIDAYLSAKENSEPSTVSRSIDGCWYSWKFIPHEAPCEIFGYIFDTTSMITAGSVEVERQFSEMKASLFRILSHLVRNPLSQMTMGIDAISESLPVLSLTRKNPFTTTLGKRITFDATSKQVEEHIQGVQKQAALLLRTHTLMEDYISFGDGQLKIHPSCFDLVQTMMNVWQKWREVGAKRRVDVELEIEPLVTGRHPSITTDKVRLVKCVVAILENAIQSAASQAHILSSSRRQVTNGEVFLHVGLGKDTLRITVQDSGPGMNAESLSLLKERLYSGEISFHEDGEMGLGISLALAYHTVVHLLHGEMWFQSSPQHFFDETPTTETDSPCGLVLPMHHFRPPNTVGFVVQICIPLQDDSVVFFSSRANQETRQACAESQSRGRRPSTPNSNIDNRKDVDDRDIYEENNIPIITVNGESMSVPQRNHILIADDDPVNLRMLGKMLSKEGYKYVLSAADGQEASNLFQTYHKKLIIILTDIQMPTSGIELAIKVRSFERTYGLNPAMPIVAITASGTGSASRDRCLQVGMSDVIAKPFTRKDIYSVIDKWGLA